MKRIEFVITLVAVVLLGAMVSANADLISYFRMEEGSGTATADALSGNDGATLTASVAWDTGDAAPVTGSGASLVFPGDGGTVQRGYTSGTTPGNYISTTNPFSVSVWVKPDAISGTTTYPHITILDDEAGNKWQLLASAAGGYTGVNFGHATGWARLKTNWDGAQAVAELVDGDWHNVVVTYNGLGALTAANFSLCFDGTAVTLVGSGGFGASSGGGTLQIGGLLSAGANHNFDGRIDELAVFNHVLTVEEIAALAAGGDAYFGAASTPGTLIYGK